MDESRFQELERQRSREEYSRQVEDVPAEYQGGGFYRKGKRKTNSFGPVYNTESYP